MTHRQLTLLGEEMDDLVGLREYIDRYADSLVAWKAPYAVALTAPWGSGKTTALRQIQNRIEKSNGLVVWFDPWRYETKEELWQGFFYALHRKLHDSSWFAEYIRNATANVRAVFSTAAKSVVSIFSGETVVPIIESLTDKNWDASMLHQFEQALDALSSDLSNLHDTDASIPADIYLFVDDLDRAHPDVCYEFVKSISLILSKPHFKMIIAVDEDRFNQNINSTFGKDKVSFSDKKSAVRFEVPPEAIETECETERVEAIEPALSEAKMAGSMESDNTRRFLQKIIQGSHPLPTLDDYGMYNFARECLKKSGLYKETDSSIEDWTQYLVDRLGRQEGFFRSTKLWINGAVLRAVQQTDDYYCPDHAMVFNVIEEQLGENGRKFILRLKSELSLSERLIRAQRGEIQFKDLEAGSDVTRFLDDFLGNHSASKVMRFSDVSAIQTNLFYFPNTRVPARVQGYDRKPMIFRPLREILAKIKSFNLNKREPKLIPMLAEFNVRLQRGDIELAIEQLDRIISNFDIEEEVILAQLSLGHHLLDPELKNNLKEASFSGVGALEETAEQITISLGLPELDEVKHHSILYQILSLFSRPIGKEAQLETDIDKIGDLRKFGLDRYRDVVGALLDQGRGAKIVLHVGAIELDGEQEDATILRSHVDESGPLDVFLFEQELKVADRLDAKFSVGFENTEIYTRVLGPRIKKYYNAKAEADEVDVGRG